MVKTGQAASPGPIRRLGFRSTRHSQLPVEVLRRHELLARYGESFFANPERLDFFLLMVTTSGHGEHEVDFCTVELRPGTVLLIRPGQVHRFRWHGTVSADLVVFPPESVQLSTRGFVLPVGSGPLYGALPLVEATQLQRDIDAIRSARERFDGAADSAALLRARLDVVLLEVGIRSEHAPPAHSPLYLAFCELLEERYATTRHAEAYAKMLGFSRRTLNRACVHATGKSAKELADERVALEAKRMLIGSDSPVERIAARLGFSEATNFGKFFHRISGSPPGDFRHRHR